MRLSRMPNGEPEIFVSVQGEGSSAGVPSVFVRLADCNLRCTWCDTRYTWDWTKHDRARETIELPVAEVAARAHALAGERVRNAVLTGGEPMLQQAALAPLAAELRARGMRIEVETNGTIAPDEELVAVVDRWNVSPKLASSGNTERARRRSDALAWFGARPNAELKFVITSEADLDEVAALAAAFDVPPERVVLSPEGTDAQTIAERSRWLAAACQRLGYRLGTRLHVLLWGAERGR